MSYCNDDLEMIPTGTGREFASRVAEHAPFLLVYLDFDLRVRFANLHCCNLLGHPRSKLLGRLLAELVDPGTLKHALAHVADLQRGYLAPREYFLRDDKGARSYVRIHGAIDRDASGAGIGYVACAANAPLGLGELVGSIVCEAGSFAAERSVAIETRAGGPSLPVSVDYRQLRGALSRLIGAAIQRSSSGDAVRVSVGSQNGCATFSVQDAVAEPPAAGHLGVNIARATIAQLGGLLQLSPVPGGGTTIRVVLPLHPSAPAGRA